jgi:hypothetical protein
MFQNMIKEVSNITRGTNCGNASYSIQQLLPLHLLYGSLSLTLRKEITSTQNHSAYESTWTWEGCSKWAIYDTAKWGMPPMAWSPGGYDELTHG